MFNIHDKKTKRVIVSIVAVLLILCMIIPTILTVLL